MANDYFDEYDKKIFLMMKEKDWRIDKLKKRKLELLKPVRNIHNTSSMPRKIGGILMWQQVIEQFLKEIIQISVSYVKAEIWPAKIDLRVDLDEKTFGSIIRLYENFSVDFENKDKTVEILKNINKNRNKVVHKIFEVETLETLEDYFEYNFDNYQGLLELLLDHYISICDLLEDLNKRVDWEEFLD